MNSNKLHRNTMTSSRWPKASKTTMHNNRARLTLAALALVALQVVSSGLVALGQQASEHELASVAPASGGPDSSGAALVEAAAAASADDLLAAESSQSPDAAGEHKAFTSAQMLRQEHAAASVAPAIYGPPHAGPQQAVFQQQQQAQQAQHMQGARYQPQAPPQQVQQAQAHHAQHHAAHSPKHMNPFMAAALAGNYGPAQQQMAAAALHAQQAQHLQHVGVHQAHHNNALPPPMPSPAQQAIAVQQAHQPQPQAQAQPQLQLQLQQLAHAPQQMAVQESSVRHNVVSAPVAALESNTIELSEAVAAQQPQAQQSSQLAVAASAQRPVIASASTAVGSSSAGPQENWPLQAPDIPKIVNLEVKCEKNLMKVSVEFDKTFSGVIFSKGHFNQGQCVHVGPNSNKQQAYFDISINSCGTQGNTQNGLYGMGQNTGSGTFFENTIVIQYDPNVQEVYDHARKLRCTWHDQYEKAVTFRPFPVDMLDIVRADFAGDNVGCWMQIQVGKGPWASEVAGIVKIGQTMTMVLAIKDEENKFDMLVRNCFAHDGKRGPIELVDKSGCITRPKLMSRFTKIKNFGSSATVLSYAHFQAFKFPDSMEVHFQCTIQICRHQCPEQCAAGPNAIGGAGYSESTISGTFNIHSGAQADQAAASSSAHLRKFGAPALSRERRWAPAESRWSNGSHHNHLQKPSTQSVGLNRVIQVVSTGDLAFAIRDKEAARMDSLISGGASDELVSSSPLSANQICMSSFNFVLALVLLALVMLCSCLAAITLYIRQRSLLASGAHKLTGCSSADKRLLHTPSPSPPQQQAATNNSNLPYLHSSNVPTQKQHFWPDRR